MNARPTFSVLLLLPVFFFLSFFTALNAQNGDGKFVVVLDAGHGGHDPGNLGNGYLEKNIALNIVLNAGKVLERTGDIKVIYTRKDDTFIDLFVRGEIANKANADLFVSVHCDSHSSDAHGAGTFVLGLHANKQNFEIAKKENSVIYLEDNYESRYADYDINSPESVIGLTIMQEEFLDQSIALAKTLQDNFSNRLKRKNREVKQAGFIVLHQTFMPSVLVETGFLTNDDEGAYLNSSKGQLEMGTAIAQAIMAYKSGVPTSVSSKTSQANAPNTPTLEPSKKEAVAEKTIEETKGEAEQFAENPAAAPVIENQATEVAEPSQNNIDNGSLKVAEVLEESKPTVDAPLEIKKEELPEKNQEAMMEEKAIPSKEIAQPEVSKANIIFKVQLMASTKEIPLLPSKFNGLNKLSQERFNKFYRYMYGSTTTFKEAKLLKSNADMKGYTTSYIVAYKDGIRIPTPDAIKMVSE